MSVTSKGQIYAVGGEGYVFLAPQGTTLGAFEAAATDYNAVSWTGTMEITEVEVTNTSDYNEETGLMNPRSIILSIRLSGTLNYHFNADPEKNILKDHPIGSYPAVKLYITRGRTAVVGPPAIPGIKQFFFWVPEAQLGPIGLPATDPNQPRGLEYTFKTNGVFSLVEQDRAAA